MRERERERERGCFYAKISFHFYVSKIFQQTEAFQVLKAATSLENERSFCIFTADEKGDSVVGAFEFST